MLAYTAVIPVSITTVNVALLLVDDYNESCITMAGTGEQKQITDTYKRGHVGYGLKGSCCATQLVQIEEIQEPEVASLSRL